jgi:membrane protein
MSAASTWNIIKTAGSAFMEDKVPRLGAALAYYLVFSIAPLIVIVVGIVGLVYGEAAAQGEILRHVEDAVGPQAAELIRTMIRSASRPGNGIVGSVLGIVMLVVGATGLFAQLQDALNTIWEVQPRPDRGVWGMLRDRAGSFVVVLGTAVVLFASLVISAVLSAVGSLAGDLGISGIGQVIDIVAALLVMTLLFAMLFRLVPDAKVAWRDVWLGAAVTAVLFVVGKVLLGVYLGHSGIGSAYGAAGSLAVLLVFLYYASQIFLFGAEITKAYAARSGTGIAPAANAIRVTEHEREQEGIPHYVHHEGEPAVRG